MEVTGYLVFLPRIQGVTKSSKTNSRALYLLMEETVASLLVPLTIVINYKLGVCFLRSSGEKQPGVSIVFHRKYAENRKIV